MKIEGYFWFSFGGNSDIGECHRIRTTEIINFPSEHEIGYGAAIRRDAEVGSFDDYTTCKVSVFTSNPITITAEFLAGRSIYPQNFMIKAEENTITFNIPVECDLREVKMFISHEKNKELPKTDFTILSWEIC